MRILHVVGARPNFVKAAPVIRALEGHAMQTLVHTGQHYDPGMSAVFFDELDLPAPDAPDAVLDVGPASPTVQTGRMVLGLEPLFVRYRPEACVVYGDVTRTAAGALAAAQHGVRLVHVEAGLRAGDRSMPEPRAGRSSGRRAVHAVGRRRTRTWSGKGYRVSAFISSATS